MTEASEEQIAALQHDVRSSGDAVRWIRTASLVLAAFVLALILAGDPGPRDRFGALGLVGRFVA